jgi:phage baseplate assembly protein gpV
MSSADDIVNLVQREIERREAGKHNKRGGLVTSWDPKKHLAKVMFQPEGHETGWIPVHTMAAADGVGHMTGLTPGDGKTTGDQVEVEYQEGDFDTGAIVSRIHSQVDVPPMVMSGEQLFMSPFSSSVHLAMDGSITLTDKGGSIVKMNGAGVVTITQGSQTLVVDTDHVHMRSGSNTIFVDSTGCHSTVAMTVAADSHD